MSVAQYPPLLMFMSDGQSYSGEDEMRSLRTVISSRTSELLVKTISFGDADSAKLEALANAGGGEFLRAVGGIELKECFEKAAASLPVKTHFR